MVALVSFKSEAVDLIWLTHIWVSGSSDLSIFKTVSDFSTTRRAEDVEI
jgi:hypothetical protein